MQPFSLRLSSIGTAAPRMISVQTSPPAKSMMPATRTCVTTHSSRLKNRFAGRRRSAGWCARRTASVLWHLTEEGLAILQDVLPVVPVNRPEVTVDKLHHTGYFGFSGNRHICGVEGLPNLIPPSLVRTDVTDVVQLCQALA